MLTAEQTAVLTKIADGVSRRYARQYPWLDRAEFVQEAWAAMLGGVHGYKPEVGDLASYAARLALRGCKGLVWRVTPATHVPQMARNDLGKHKAARAGDEAAAAVPVSMIDVEELVLMQERAALLERLVGLHAPAGVEGAAVRAVLLGGEHPKVVAERHGLTQARVEKKASQVRVALRQKNKQALAEVL